MKFFGQFILQKVYLFIFMRSWKLENSYLWKSSFRTLKFTFVPALNMNNLNKKEQKKLRALFKPFQVATFSHSKNHAPVFNSFFVNS